MLAGKKPTKGTLHALGDTGKVWDGFNSCRIDKNMPQDWKLMPHRARQAIPVLTTLDGGLIYPQIEGHENNNPPEYPLVARFLGMAKNPVLLADTSTSVPC